MRRLVPALAAALACAACTVPMFDPAASGAVAAIRASHLVGSSYSTMGPDMDSNGEPDFDLSDDLLVFMPERWVGAIAPGKGFVIRRRAEESTNRIWYQWWDGAEVQWLDSSAGYTEDERLRWRWPVTLKNGSSLGAIIFEWADTETYIDRLHADTGGGTCDWIPAYHSYTTLEDDIQAQIGLVSTPIVVGMSVNALSLPGQDRAHVLVREGANYSEAEVLVSDPGIVGAFSASITPFEYALPFLGTPRHVNYARDEVQGRSYAQWIEDDAWRTVAWKGSFGTGVTETDGAVSIPHRVDAVLTIDPIWGWTPASYALSTEGQIARLYSYNGVGTAALVAEFGLGTLRFVGEMYLDGEWQLVFTRSVLDYQKNPIRIRFETRGIYSKDLLAVFGL